MKALQRVLTVFLCALIVFLPVVGSAGEFASAAIENSSGNEGGEASLQDEREQPEKPAPQLILSDSRHSLSTGSEMRIKAEAVNFETADVNISWSSDNPGVASVSSGGVVSAKAKGKAEITAVASDGETSVSASCTVTVTSRRSLFHYLLMIGYRYSKMGDYYYSDNNYAWQKPFGFVRLYDTASQLIGYQYDFTRMVFTYGNKDWLVEFWKGQYAPFQYGGEIGVYTKYAAGFGDTPVSAYNCPAKSDWLNMEMTLYQKQSDGSVRRVFTRDYTKYWWCDGYRIGRINKTKPATELQMVSRITLKDEKMALAFAESMLDAGFKQVDGQAQLKDDTFCREGSDVYFIWRNLTGSQHFIPVMLDIGIDPVGAFLSGIRSLAGIFLGGLGGILDIG